MPSIPLPDSLEPSDQLKSYSQQIDYSVEGNPGPYIRSQTLIYRSNDLQWWIKATFQGDIYSTQNETTIKHSTSKRERRNELQTFVRLIDYGSLPLLEDTVTELILDEGSRGQNSNFIIVHTASEESAHNPFVKIAARLRWTVQEDPSRVVYPLCTDFPSFRCINLHEREIADGIFQVLNANDKTPYILEVVNRPLYQPHPK